MAKRTLKPRLPDDTDSSQVRMGFGEHLDELRKRLIYSAYGSVGFIAVCLYYARDIMSYLTRPYLLALKAHHLPQVFSVEKPPEVVITYLSIGMKAGLVLASPWIIYQIWLFIAAGLFQRERKVVYKFVGPSLFLFLLGVAFFYFLVLPLTLNFFIGFTDHTAVGTPTANWFERATGLGADPDTMQPTTIPAGTQPNLQPIPKVYSDPPKPPDGSVYLYYDARDGLFKYRIGDDILVFQAYRGGSLFNNIPQLDQYMTFITWTGLIFGLAFELPMVILILAKIGIVNVKTFRKIRKYAYFVIAVISCIAAPSTDVLTMLCLMVPLIGLYEAGVIAAAISTRKAPAEEAATD